jgi:ABC-type transporter Mla MlaB component
LTHNNDEHVGQLDCESDDAVMRVIREPESRDAPLLEVELAESPGGYLARFRGELVAETMAVLWGIEPILLNETRVSIDVSGVTSVDQAGLIAALKLVEALHAFGGSLTFAA